MQPAVVVYIPRQDILAEVYAQTGLAHKYSSVTNEDGQVKACVVVDVPQMPGRPQEKTRAFYGEPKGDLDGALESAAELALGHLVDEYGIAIVDWNYSAFVECREELLAAQESLLGKSLPVAHQIRLPVAQGPASRIATPRVTTLTRGAGTDVRHEYVHIAMAHRN